MPTPRLSGQVALFIGVAVLAAASVPTARAVEPVVEGGAAAQAATRSPAGAQTPVRAPARTEPTAVDATTSLGDWLVLLVFPLVGVAVVLTTLTVHDAATRRGTLASP